MSEEIKKIQQNKGGIDFMHIARLAWRHRKLYYKVLGVTFVVACIIGFSIPKTYRCEVMLAPELSTSSSTSSSLLSLASSYGLRVGSSSMIGNSDALFPTLYPDMMISTDFLTSLFDVQIRQADSLTTQSYYDYLLNDQKKPWWSAAIGGIIGGVANVLKGMFPEDSLEVDDDHVNPFMLTKDQTRIAELVARKVVCDVDQKTLVITIDVTDQDPLVCATLADSVKNRLQDFITGYRTNKARIDLEYYDNLCKESKANYDKARQKYADFVDSNNDLVLQSVRSKQTDLENEMQLQYNAYSNYSSLRQGAEARVQQATPAFTTLQNATVPIKPVGPRKKRIVMIFFFLAILGTTAYLLHKENELLPMLGLSK